MLNRWSSLPVILLGLLASSAPILAQGDGTAGSNGIRFAQEVAVDECDPATFNAALGPGECQNFALGYTTTLANLIAEAAAGTPNPGWDILPDSITINQGTILSVKNQGGEPHTFTEVAKFGGGFETALNPPNLSTVAPECQGGFGNVQVAKTRIVPGSSLELGPGLSKGVHLFECCIHPWMQVTVTVQ
jgi:hypothetical protein